MTDLPRVIGRAGRDLIQYKTEDEEDAGQLFVSENPENEKKINAKMVLLSQKTGSVREDMKKVDFIIEKDTRILEQWRKSKDKRKWEVAVTLLENRSLPLKEISEKIERPVPLIRKWIRIFNYFGIAGIKETLPLNQVSDEGAERGNAALTN